MNNNFNKYYNILGLDKNKNPNENDIKKAYKKSALKWHPDKWNNKTDKEKEIAEKKFKEISEAYEILNDPEKKNLYDRFGENGIKQTNNQNQTPSFIFRNNSNPFNRHHHFNNMNGVFSEFIFEKDNSFQQNNRPHTQAKQKNEKNIDIYLSLEELYRGLVKKMRITDTITCPNTQITRETNEILEINIIPGWKEGTKITFNTKSSKIIFTIKEKSHPYFVRENNNLIWKYNLTNQQILNRKKKNFTIPLLNGEKYELSTENYDIFNKKLLIKSKGMPIKHTNPIQYGDLIIEFNIVN